MCGGSVEDGETGDEETRFEAVVGDPEEEMGEGGYRDCEFIVAVEC